MTTMTMVTIDREERDWLRKRLEGDIAWALGDLKTYLLRGEADDVAWKMRELIAWGCGVLDAIGWEVEGTAESYDLDATPELVSYVEEQREIVASDVADYAWGLDALEIDEELRKCAGQLFGGPAGIRLNEAKELARSGEELVIAERVAGAVGAAGEGL